MNDALKSPSWWLGSGDAVGPDVKDSGAVDDAVRGVAVEDIVEVVDGGRKAAHRHALVGAGHAGAAEERAWFVD